MKILPTINCLTYLVLAVSISLGVTFPSAAKQASEVFQQELPQHQQQRLFPQPQTVIWREQHFKFNQNTRFTYNSEEASTVAHYFSDFIQPATGYVPELIDISAQKNTNEVRDNNEENSNVIEFSLIKSRDKTESYYLKVTDKKIFLRANSEVGLFYGVQTLRQLLPAEIETRMPINKSHWLINGVEINDSPRFNHRGMHLDVSRHFFNVGFVKRYIDWLAFHKMNVFQWHLTDDQGWRIEINSMPELTRTGAYRKKTVVGHTYDYQSLFDNKAHSGFYTQAQIKDVVAYAKARHVEVIPEIDVPGHTSALLAAYPQYSCHQQAVQVVERFGIFENVLCPTEATFAMLTKIYQEVAALFPSKYIHIGGDEVIKKQWLESYFVQQLMQEQNLNSPEEVQSYFIKRVSAIISQLNKTLIGWDEIMEGGIAKDAVIMSWRGTQGGISASKKGHDAIMSPYQFTYLDAYQSRSVEEPKAIHGFLPLKMVYDYEPVPADLPKDSAKHILGVQGALWTEYVKTARHAEYMLFPRLSALAEVMWSKPEQKNWQRYSGGIKALLTRYQYMGLNPSYSAFNATATANIIKQGAQSSNAALLSVSMQSEISSQHIFYRTYPPIFAEQFSGKVSEQPLTQWQPYQKAITVNTPTTYQVVTQAPQGGQYFGNTQLTVAPHKALGKKISFVHEPSSGRERILDGVMAYDQYYNVEDFAVFYDEDLDATIDFVQETKISQVVMGVDTGKHRQLHPPKRVEVFGSNDAQQWQSLALLTEADAALNHPVLNMKFSPVNYRYLRVVAQNRKNSADPQIPELPLYIDEIVVY
ncbi:family 20 glycosylhydrolase [Colwellia sp. D2M02]|uniref:glycoside hydrolase family 20 protein n=1 Tax=Colwellia sp. D2M02 TaxID=2841562 RepID=UPI00339D4C00